MAILFPSLCFYPTTSMLVDDDYAFINNLRLFLPDTAQPLILKNPQEVLTHVVEKKEYFTNWNNNCLQLNELDESDNLLALQQSITLDLLKLQKAINNDNYAFEPSVLITDYDMPQMTGYELCKQLKDFPCKKIMITGVADKNIAVEAFNEGLINYFIVKHSPNFFQDFTHAVIQSQHAYFKEKNHLMTTLLASTLLWCLNDSSVIKAIIAIFNKFSITQYSIVTATGSLLMKNASGQRILLLIANKYILNEYKQIAKNNHASKAIYKQLAEYKAIPCLLSKEDYELPCTEWHNMLIPAEKITENCFYAIKFLEE